MLAFSCGGFALKLAQDLTLKFASVSMSAASMARRVCLVALLALARGDGVLEGLLDEKWQ